ncbi:MAG TPA: nucleotidyltransferase family protein [Alloacidobacterium sp.]|nr:nucleotidyltransferase family protein [Alloacidobacterium sp.]
MSNEAAIPEAELLIACLRGTASAVPRGADCRLLAMLAETHGVLPLVYRALTASGIEVPDKAFRETVLNSQLSSKSLAEELEHLLAVFAMRGIEVLPLKGPALAETLYGDVTLRPCVDLDLLVRVGGYHQAEQLLLEEGWEASAPADEYQRKFMRGESMVELHFGVASPRSFPFDVEGTWNRARNGAFRGQPMKTMSETDRALYLFLHGLKHGYGRLIWILDAALALETMPCGPRELIECAKAQGLEQVLYISCAMVEEVFPKRLPESLTAVLGDSPRALQAARASVQRLLAGAAGTGRDPEIWGFYVQAETGPAMRWCRRLAFFAPTNEDSRWLNDHRLPHFLAPVMRPFRLLAKYGLKRAWRTAFPTFH